MSQPNQNQLLAALPKRTRDRIIPRLQLVELSLGEVIDEAGQKIRYVHFPGDCVISLLCIMQNGQANKISLVGRDGIVGIYTLMGGTSRVCRAVVQSAGTAYRMPATELKHEFQEDPAIRILLLRYIQALITQIAQTAVCNRRHRIEQQLCRFLLQSLDRLPTNELAITQELIANMLGVRREGVTEAAGKLQKRGVIEYQRGHIAVINRSKLERLCCECYAMDKKQADRLTDCSNHP